LGKFQPELVSHLSIASQLLFASLSFSSSWFIVAYLVRKKQLAKIMFGI
jgi:hypothetical protein